MASEIGVIADIPQVIVHESHIPLQVEAQPAVLQRPGNFWKGRTLLRYGKHAGITLLHNRVQVLYHFYGFQVFFSTVDIRYPFPVLFAVIQVKHAGHGIHANAVHMIFFHPEQGIGNQVVGNLGPAVIIYQRSPMGVSALPGVFVLIKAGAVKIGKAVGIPGKMGRNPVQNNADSRLVQLVDKPHEILWRAVPGCGRVIADHLISPGAVQRMLHHGHQLHMSIAHILYIRNQPLRNVPVICVYLALLRLYKGTEVQLIDADGHVPVLKLLPFLQKTGILPDKALQICNHGGGFRAQLGRVAVRVCLQIGQPGFQLQLKFIVVPGLCPGNENFKNTGVPKPSHLVNPSVPAVKIPHCADSQGRGRPHREIGSLYAVQLHGMGPQLFIDGIMDSVFELICILFGNQRFISVGLPS